MKALLLILGLAFFSVPVGAQEKSTTMKVCDAINRALNENFFERADRKRGGASTAEMTHIQEKRDRLHEAWMIVCQNRLDEL